MRTGEGVSEAASAVQSVFISPWVCSWPAKAVSELNITCKSWKWFPLQMEFFEYVTRNDIQHCITYTSQDTPHTSATTLTHPDQAQLHWWIWYNYSCYFFVSLAPSIVSLLRLMWPALGCALPTSSAWCMAVGALSTGGKWRVNKLTVKYNI